MKRSDQDVDIDAILSRNPTVVGNLQQLRTLLLTAWEYGYTTGMADSAKIDALIADPAAPPE